MFESHTDKVAALPPKARQFYDDLTARCSDSFEVEKVTGMADKVMKTRQGDKGFIDAYNLIRQFTMGKADPEFWKRINTDPIEYERKEFNEIKSGMQRALNEARSVGDTARADSIQADIDRLQTPEQLRERKQEKIARQQELANKAALNKAKSLYRQHRESGIRTAMSSGNKDWEDAEAYWDHKYSDSARKTALQQANYMGELEQGVAEMGGT